MPVGFVLLDICKSISPPVLGWHVGLKPLDKTKTEFRLVRV